MHANINFMISSKKLNESINEKRIIIIDVRSIEEYSKGHIINAINIPEIFTYLPEGLTTPTEKEDFINFYKDIFSKAGVGSNDTVVFYENRFTLMSPRGLIILKYLGHNEENIKVLDGGYYTWCKNNFETTTTFIQNNPKDFIVNINEDFFVDYNEMKVIIKDSSIVTLDVRDKDEWIGISSSPYGINYAPKKGRIPNAIWIEWYEFITNDMLSVRSLENIQLALDKKAIKEDDDIVLYCFKGARIANTYIALRKLGYKNIRIYFAGWNEWCRKEDAPIINEVEHSDNLILQENIILKNKLDELNLKQANLIDFSKYNNQAIFAFNREGEICSANQAKKEHLPHITKIKDILPSFKRKDIYNMIDNNQEKALTITAMDRYYSLQLRGSRDSNKILVYSFDTTEINHLNNSLDIKIQEIERSEKIFRTLFEVAPIFIDSFDKNGKCVLWNKECEKVFGWTIEEINKSTNSLELFYPEVEMQKKAIDTITNEAEKIFRVWHPLNKKGEKLTTMWAHIYLSNGETINVGYDLTKNKQNEKLLFEQSKMASLGEMIGNIAHQWRQPLSVISTAATGMKMQKEYNNLEDIDIDNICDLINKNAQYLSKTIDDFRNFIKGNREKTIFNLKDNIHSFLQLVEGSIKDNNIKVLLTLDEKITIDGYENELAQCFINIFKNAKDALINIKNEDEKMIFISTIDKKDKAIIKIRDNALGIKEKILPKIFEPYFTTKHQSQGTGLGLHMTYNLIVDGMNGTIHANNVNYEYEYKNYSGVEFTIIIPKSYS